MTLSRHQVHRRSRMGFLLPAALLVWLLSPATMKFAHAHEDRGLRLAPDGSVLGLPPEWRDTRLHIEQADNGDIVRLSITGRGYRRVFHSCVLHKLRRIRSIVISGSWYHDVSSFPPYLNIDLSTGKIGADTIMSMPDHSITLSILDGRILGAYESTRSWLGYGRTRKLVDAHLCSGWR